MLIELPREVRFSGRGLGRFLRTIFNQIYEGKIAETADLLKIVPVGCWGRIPITVTRKTLWSALGKVALIEAPSPSSLPYL